MNCGGCLGEGRHARWCLRVVGAYAARIGRGSEYLEGLGDTIGSNNPELANLCYGAAGRLKAEANKEADAYMKKNGTSH